MNNRHFCWDNHLIETSENVQIQMHKPEKQNIALICDNLWEGHHNGYPCVLKVGNMYRLYYRAANSFCREDGEFVELPSVICMAESYDGIHFRKPNVGKHLFNGTRNNNIVVSLDEHIDNFSVCYDTNPNCPPDEKFKALSALKDGLVYFASADGLEFHRKYVMPLHGAFDSYNLTFWDETTQQYFAYYRGYHLPDGTELPKDATPYQQEVAVRDVRVATSKDFVNWTEYYKIEFEEGQSDSSLYTNQIVKYHRSANTFIGFPTRYVKLASDDPNFKYLPLPDYRAMVIDKFGRSGSSFTDCVIMTSRDGFTFNRRDEAFMTPGIENRDNWWYGDCYMAHGLVETMAEKDGAPNELSFYVGENYRVKNVHFRRYTLRLDGFFSWYAPYAGGEVLTKPIVVDGDELHINFATAGLSNMQIILCDEDGNELDGYASYKIFGDSVDRPVEFDRPLSALKGQTVRLKIKLRDAHLYSFVFE